MTDGKRRIGFAALTKEQRKEMGAIGGRASHAKGTGHEWTSEEAKEAGRRGGARSRGGRRAILEGQEGQRGDREVSE